MRRSKVLFGERVELRRHTRSNYPIYSRWYGDPEVWRLTSWAPEPLTAVTVERLFDERERSATSDSFAIHRHRDNQPLGVITLTNINQAHASSELSLVIGERKDRGQGYGSDALRVLLRYGFETLGLHRIALSVFEFNQPAISTYKKSGFSEEGRLRHAILRDGAWHDAMLMSILEDEWKTREAREHTL